MSVLLESWQPVQIGDEQNLGSGTTAQIRIDRLATAAGCLDAQNYYVEVPIVDAIEADTKSISKEWSTGATEPDAPLVTVTVLGYRM